MNAVIESDSGNPDSLGFWLHYYSGELLFPIKIKIALTIALLIFLIIGIFTGIKSMRGFMKKFVLRDIYEYITATLVKKPF